MKQNVRQVVLDTETTGRSAETNRIIEIGALELIDRVPSGKTYHVYINPEQAVEEGALRVHGLSNAFLADKPLFSEVVEPFMDFIHGAELIIHNAPFDVGFIDAELKRLAHPVTEIKTVCSILDSLVLARSKHPGQRNSLDALCKRYEVDNSKRAFHGALLDACLLSDVYLRMTGGQNSLFSAKKNTQKAYPTSDLRKAITRQDKPVSMVSVSQEALTQHEGFMHKMQGD